MKRFSVDEEKELARAWQETGDMVARDKLVLSNMGLVKYLAVYYYAGLHLEYEDARQFGVLGLLRAADKFDPDRGVPFGTYASKWIVTFMQRGGGRNAELVRIPVTMGEQVNKLYLLRRDVPDLTEVEYASAMGVTLERLHELDKWSMYGVSLDEMTERAGPPVYREEDFTSDMVLTTLRREDLISAVKAVTSERNAEIVLSFFGLVNPADDPSALAARHGVSRQRVYQIVDSVLPLVREEYPELIEYLFSE